MKKTLKNKVLFGVPAILIAVMLVATVVVLVIINKQNRQAANRLLQNSFNIIRYTISESQDKLLFNSRQMATLSDMGGKIKYLTDNKMYFKYRIMRPTYVEIATGIYDIGTTADVFKAAIYNINGELMAFTIIEQSGSTVGFIHSQNNMESARLKPDEELTHESWTKQDSLPAGIEYSFGRGIPAREVIHFEIVDNSLCLVAYVPVMGKEYNPATEKIEPKQVGMVVTVQRFGTTFAKKMAELTGTEVNIFTATGLIAGTYPQYQSFNLKELPAVKGEWTLAEQKVIFNDVNVADSSYFQGVLPIYSGLECVAAIVSLYSKAIARANTAQIVTLLSIVYLVGIILIVPITLLMVVRGIVNPIQRTASMMREIALKEDFSKMLKIESKDEIGQLALSFNKMTAELKISRDKLLSAAETEKKRVAQLEVAYKKLRETQAQLIQAGKMVAVGQLGAGVAHELNNPMGGILGYTQFILEKLKKPDFSSEDFRSCKKYLEMMEKQSQRCKAIVENLLRFSRIPRAGFEAADINRVVGDTLALLSYQLKAGEIKLTKDLALDLPKVAGSPSQLQQVFTNMILNAKKAMQKGGGLKISTRKVQATEEKSETVEIEFTDTGCGIPQEDQDRIFEPFFTTGKLGEKSLGLGLALCYQIIQNHKGQIELKSEVGKGTTFTISIPVG